MAITFAQEDLHTVANPSATGEQLTTIALRASTAPVAGRCVALFFGAKVSSGTGVAAACSVTDAKGNTWTILKTALNGTLWAMIAITQQDAGTLTTADDITVHTGTAATINSFTGRIEEFGSISATPTDVSASSTGTSTAPATGTTAATAQDDEVVLAMLATASNQVVSKDPAYSAFPTASLSVSTSPTLSSVSMYKLTAGLGAAAQSAMGSLPSSAAWVGLIAAIKGTGVALPANSIKFNDGLVLTYDIDPTSGSVTNLQVLNPSTPPSASTPHPDFPAGTGYQLVFGTAGTWQFDIDTAGVVTNLTKIL